MVSSHGLEFKPSGHFIKSEQGTEEKYVGDIKGHRRTQSSGRRQDALS
jgi:hypothetical protein